MKRQSRRAGFTLIEILVASTFLAGLMILTLGTIRSSAQPIAETTVRAEVFTQAKSRINVMTFTLEGCKNASVGSLSGSTFTAGADQHTDPVNESYIGRAIQFQRVLGYVPTNSPPETLEAASIYAFVADGTFQDAASTPKLKLVRILPNGYRVDLLTNIPQRSAITAGNPPTSTGPHFWLNAPSELEIRFSIWRQTDYDTSTQQRRFMQVDFVRKVQLRNSF